MHQIRSFSFFLMLLFSCNPKPTNSTKKIDQQQPHDIKQYFLKNSWDYPIHIDSALLHKSIKRYEIINQKGILFFISFFKNWCLTNNLWHDEAVRISGFVIRPLKKSLNIFEMETDLVSYKEGTKINDSVIVPIEGHGIEDNIFLTQSETAVFRIKGDSIAFIKWR